MMNQQKHIIALGFFDGVHLGHGALLSLCAQRAAELGAVPAAFTFDPHPSALILKAPVPLLTTPADRAGLMERVYGIREVILAHYDEGMMKTPWREFVTDLVAAHGAVHLVAGHDFHFGYKGEGNPQRLRDLCGELGIGCDIVSKVELGGITVSSSHIRTLIAQGEMAEAVRFLGHPHVLTGTVTDRGLTVPPGILPPADGDYAGQAVTDGETLPVLFHAGGGRLTGLPAGLEGRELRAELTGELPPEGGA